MTMGTGDNLAARDEVPTEDELLADSQAEPEELRVSRRGFLSGALAGGAAGLVVAAGTGVGVWRAMDEQVRQALADSEAHVARLQGLVDRYERLEKVGLDGILRSGMAALALPLGAVELGARALKAGLDLIEESLLSLIEALPTAHEALAWLEGRVSALADTISRLEARVSKALDRAAENAIVEAIRELAGKILDSLPFGLGDKFREALEGWIELVTGVDDLVRSVGTRVLAPLHEHWFPGSEGEGLAATLFEPLRMKLLDPLEAHLANLAALSDAWQQKLLAPAQAALEERARLREEIEKYKADQGLG